MVDNVSEKCFVYIFVAEVFFSFFFFFLGVEWDWVHLVCRPLIGLLHQPRTIGDECEAVDRMRIGRGNQSIRRKPAPVQLRPPQIPHDLLGSNPGRRGGKPATNCLSCGTAMAEIAFFHRVFNNVFSVRCLETGIKNDCVARTSSSLSEKEYSVVQKT
jgi:hypothetical protein